MTDLAMNFATNDIIIEGGDMKLADGAVAIQQDLQQQLQVWFGEWFLDTTVGIPFKQQILVKNPNLDVVQALIINAAQRVNGVEEITAFTFDYDPRRRSLNMTISAKTSNGQIITVSPAINVPATIQGTPYP